MVFAKEPKVLEIQSMENELYLLGLLTYAGARSVGILPWVESKYLVRTKGGTVGRLDDRSSKTCSFNIPLVEL